MDKIVFKADDVRAKILSGLDFIAKPVVSTLSPKGHNVFIESVDGNNILTNDGVTIAKNLTSKDQVEETIVKIVKDASLRTNAAAGDGTTTTVLLCDVLTREALKLIDAGYSWIQVRDELEKGAKKIIARIEKNKIVVKNDAGLLEIATTSANNDKEIAKNVLEAIKVAREDGMVFIDGSQKNETEVIKDLGFMIKSGVMYQELLQKSGSQSVMFKDVPVLLTDKKLYYAEEAETILRTAIQAGYKQVVIVARDFMGDSINTLIANHTKGVIEVMLVKDDNITDKDNTSLIDLATYIGGKVITDKRGSIVNKLKPEDFVVVSQAFSDYQKTLFTPKIAPSKELKERVKMLQEKLKEDPDNRDIKSRLASLTTGVVTIKVHGRTPIELREKVFRYEDAINATRAAMRDGYLPGGGSALLKSFNESDYENKDFVPLFRKYTEAVLRQISINCGGHADSVVRTVRDNRSGSFGYNALTDDYGDLIKLGIVDPFNVVRFAIENSVSVANIIISIKHFVVNDIEDEKE